MQILIVEDDQRLARQLKKGLEEQGHVVNLAFDGLHGLEAGRQGRFDVLVLDVMLPGLDGSKHAGLAGKAGMHPCSGRCEQALWRRAGRASFAGLGLRPPRLSAPASQGDGVGMGRRADRDSLSRQGAAAREIAAPELQPVAPIRVGAKPPRRKSGWKPPASHPWKRPGAAAAATIRPLPALRPKRSA